MLDPVPKRSERNAPVVGYRRGVGLRIEAAGAELRFRRVQWKMLDPVPKRPERNSASVGCSGKCWIAYRNHRCGAAVIGNRGRVNGSDREEIDDF